jgi:hypothetical protein
MSEEIRFTLQNGKGWEGDLPVDAFSHSGQEHIYCVGSPCPDFVVYPRTPEFKDHAGLRGDVVEVRTQLVRCPMCKEEGNKTVWRTEHGFEVILCSGCKRYVWVKSEIKNEQKGTSDGSQQEVV